MLSNNSTVVGGSKVVDYAVSNKAEPSIGRKRFDKEVSADYAKQTLSTATEFIHKLFPQNTNEADMKNVPKVSMIVENIDGVAFASNGEIHISSSYIERYPGDIKKEITVVLHHEVTHVCQWDANGQAPSGLTEGIADFVRLKAGYAAENWVTLGRGDDWYQGYDFTAQILGYSKLT